jgi:hypothetical protein
MASAAVEHYEVDPLRGMPIGTTDGLARQIIRAIERRKPRVIYPTSYWAARWFPGITSWVMSRFSPLPGK